MKSEKPEPPPASLHGITFYPVPEFSQPSVVFGARESEYFPRRNLPKIPMEYEKMVHSIFYNGGELPKLSPIIDREKATNAVRAWLSSFQPSHESKVATVAYALWVWTTI